MTNEYERLEKPIRAGLHKAARFLGKTPRKQSARELLEDLLTEDRDDATLKSYFWALMRDFDFTNAVSTLEEIRANSNGGKHTKAWLKKAYTGPLEGVALAGRMKESRTEHSLAPEPGRVLYILHNTLPYSSGGYATRGHGMAKAFDQAGVDIICISRPGFPHDIPGDHTGKQTSSQDVIDGIVYSRLAKPFRSDLSAVKYMERSAKVIGQAIRQYRPSCVISASNHQTALPACIAARQHGVPFVYEVRGFWEITRISREPEFANGLGYAMQVYYETAVAKAADHVLTLTGPMKEELIRRGVNEESITLAPNSCDPLQFVPRPRDSELAALLGIPADVPVIGYIGSFVQYEGLEHLVEAAVKLRDRGLDFRLLLVGNENASGSERGPITEEILRISKGAGLDDLLLMPGRVPHDQVEAYYSLIDIAPFPRKPQPVTEMVSPMKPLEAFAMEKAVVVSSVKALEEMVQHNRTGLVFRKGDVGDLADTLAQLIEDGALRERLGKAGRAWVEQERTWQRTAKKALTDMAARGVSILPDLGTGSAPVGVAMSAENSLEDTSCVVAKKVGLSAQQSMIYERVKAKFDDRDAKEGKISFSQHDWLRTRTAFELCGDAANIIDIGIGQGQLVNLLCELPNTSKVVGIDRVRHSKHIAPVSEKYQFLSLDITSEFPKDLMQSDVTIAMEIFEHIDVEKLDKAIKRARGSSRHGKLFASVPYQEKHPLYHYDRPFGHKQSFDDGKICEYFGEKAIWTNFNELWYLIFVAEGLALSGLCSLDEFKSQVRGNLEASCTH